MYVEVKPTHTLVQGNDVLGAVESVKAASDVYAPVSGEVLEINEALSESPGLVNESPEEQGWLAKIKTNEDAAGLMDKEAYEAFCQSK